MAIINFYKILCNIIKYKINYYLYLLINIKFNISLLIKVCRILSKFLPILKIILYIYSIYNICKILIKFNNYCINILNNNNTTNIKSKEKINESTDNNDEDASNLNLPELTGSELLARMKSQKFDLTVFAWSHFNSKQFRDSWCKLTVEEFEQYLKFFLTYYYRLGWYTNDPEYDEELKKLYIKFLTEAYKQCIEDGWLCQRSTFFLKLFFDIFKHFNPAWIHHINRTDNSAKAYESFYKEHFQKSVHNGNIGKFARKKNDNDHNNDDDNNNNDTNI